MLIISNKDIQAIYSMKECMNDVEQAFRFHTDRKTVTPTRLKIQVEQGTLAYMPSYIKPIEYAGVKIYSSYLKNTESGRPTLQAISVLTDVITGEHIALMDATYLTVLRTGASSGVATKYLSRENSEVCTVLGCGAQSLGQIQAVMEVRDIKKILLFNRTRRKAEELKLLLRDIYPYWQGDIIIFEDPDKAVAMADILICATRSTLPIFNGETLKEGVHINAIGSAQPYMQEIDVKTLNRTNKIVVDTLEGVIEEAGDFVIPIENGEWDIDSLYCELGNIITGQKAARENQQEITLFKSVGIAYLDTIVSKAVYDKAKELNIGTKVSLS